MSFLYESSLCLDFEHVTRCYRRMFPCVLGGKGQLLAGAGCCVKGLVKVTRLRVYYTSAYLPRILITSGCDTFGRVALLAHFGGIR